MKNALGNIRRAMRNRARESNIATVARDIGVSANDLDSFIYNATNLPEPALHKLVDYAFSGNLKLDLANDELTPTPGPEPKVLNSVELPGEWPKKPDLSKDKRRPTIGALKLDQRPHWDPRLDKLWRHRPESRGPLD